MFGLGVLCCYRKPPALRPAAAQGEIAPAGVFDSDGDGGDEEDVPDLIPVPLSPELAVKAAVAKQGAVLTQPQPILLSSTASPESSDSEDDGNGSDGSSPETISGASLEEEVTLWLEVLAGDERPEGADLGGWLRDGRVLVQAAEAVQPGICGGDSRLAEDALSRVSAFLDACRTLDVPATALFPARALLEARDLRRVRLCVYAFARAARGLVPSFRGPYLGPSPKPQIRPELAAMGLLSTPRMGQPQNSVAAEAEDGNRWVVVFDGMARVRSAMSRTARVLREVEQGMAVRGRRYGDWVELENRGGFMMIMCLGEEVLRRQVVFEVLLEKQHGVLPGITWTATPAGLEIRSIASDGLVGLWNAERPDSQVEVRDVVLEVNGVDGTECIRSEWAKRNVFALKVLTFEKPLRN